LKLSTRLTGPLAALATALLMAACGGGSGGSGGGDPVVVQKPADRAEAARFLTQATFGPTEADIDRVMAIGYAGWIDEQWAAPVTGHRAHWQALDAAVKAQDPNRSADQDGVFSSFWKSAVTGRDQLRQRLAFALSQIFVISMQDNTLGDNPRAVADYLDMLADKGAQGYRQLLEGVSRHPTMGVYLSHLRNRKADARTGRVPDENYAREVMQLFSIGLVQLDLDGTAKSTGGVPIETYGQSDIAGLAKVFTGFSYACPDWPDNNCFNNGSGDSGSDPDRAFKPMLGYPQYHSTEEKAFLGTVIAAQTQANPDSSLATALDALAAHPNVGPFIGKQLIQRLVTSNPSPAYVSAVAAAFNDNGSGVRGDMKAVVKTILMHPEARTASATGGKLREPVLKLSALLRAFPYASDSGWWRVGNTDNPGTSLGQTPMRSPSVFNFWRPGFVPPGTQAAAASLVVPEMQIASETSAAGYVNAVRDYVAQGVGASATVTVNGASVNRRDIQPDFSAELSLAEQPDALVEQVNTRLLAGAMPAALKTEIVGAVGSIAVPVLNGTGSNQAQIDSAKRNRVNAAIFLTMVSPEFQVQK
jgi:uncharacterized protein (DUF1800 family)